MAILIMLNNYFHDLAAGIFFGSIFVLYYIRRSLTGNGGEQRQKLLEELFGHLTRLYFGALLWILIGGIPRVIFYRKYEWWDAVKKGITTALIIKHTVFFIILAASLLMWFNIKDKLQAGK
jgi:hypothetical protein